jgi:mycothiol synthase
MERRYALGMVHTSTDAPSVGAAPDHLRRDAASLLLAVADQVPAAAEVDAFLDELGRSPDGFAGLLVATRHERLAGAALVRSQPGNSALVWPPRTVAEEDDAVGLILALELADFASRRGLALADALVELASVDAEEAAPLAANQAMWLQAAGFRRGATLEYLSVETRPSEGDDGPLRYETYQESQQARLADLVRQTYEGTLDCPALDGARDLDDVLADYRSIGRHDPGLWWFVRAEDRDIGCLLLTDHPDDQRPELAQCELVYMGLTPAARGKRWGRSLAREAIRRAALAGRSRLALAVDVANTPAVRVYRSVGFVPFARRELYLWLPDSRG